MRFAFLTLILVVLVASTAVSAFAGPYIPLIDSLESAGTVLAKSEAGVFFAPGFQDNSAGMSGGGVKLIYESKYFPSTGTIAFDVKPTSGYYGTILDTVGTKSAHAGDLTVHYYSAVNKIFFDMWDTNNQFQRVSADMSAGAWSHVGISYTSTGIQLYVNGQLQSSTAGIFSRATNAGNVYVGDMDLDYYVQSALPGFVGFIDNLKTSSVGNDTTLLSAAAVPEPGAILVLLSGLASSAIAFRKRRK